MFGSVPYDVSSISRIVNSFPPGTVTVAPFSSNIFPNSSTFIEPFCTPSRSTSFKASSTTYTLAPFGTVNVMPAPVSTVVVGDNISFISVITLLTS